MPYLLSIRNLTRWLYFKISYCYQYKMLNSAKYVHGSGLVDNKQKDESDQKNYEKPFEKGDSNADDVHTERAFKSIKIDSDPEDIIEDEVLNIYEVKDTFYDSSEAEEEGREVQKKTKSHGEVGVTAVCVYE